jgi:Mg-chelatase subunit ChlD
MKTTKKNSVLVNFVLDKSGSMSSVQDSTISAVNEYVKSLAKDGKADYSFMLTTFDTTVSKGVAQPIAEVQDLNKTTYRPDGMTALYDAVCSSINALKSAVKKNQKVLTVVMTDGGENSSKEYTQAQLKTLIEECEKAGNWTFVFLGANQDAWATAQNFGFAPQNVSNFNSTDKGITRTMSMLVHNTSAYASSASLSTSNFYSVQDQKDLNDTK